MDDKTTESKKSASEQMMDATAHFIGKLEEVPGWRESRVSRLAAAMDLDGIYQRQLDEVQPVALPHPLTVLPERVWSAEEWDRIQQGYRSRDMDEKWDVFVEDGVVYLHRSWTGNGIYEARFAPAAGGVVEIG